jgi:hypothetical protein
MAIDKNKYTAFDEDPVVVHYLSISLSRLFKYRKMKDRIINHI